MTLPPEAEVVGRISVREHEARSTLEIPHGWLVAFPRFEKALQLLKKTRKYIDGDWCKLDGDLERLIFGKMAGLGARKGFGSKVVYGDHFTAVRANNRKTRSRFGGVNLIPKGSAGNFSQRQRALMAQRPRPEQCEVCERQDATICWDHDHAKGKFRGWICRECNIALGCVGDSPERLRKLAAYLERSKS